MNYVDLLREYAKLYDKGNYLTATESKIYSEVKNTPELADIVNKIDSIPTLDEKYKEIERYAASLKQDNKNELDKAKENLEKLYKIEISSIDFKHLSNGRDIIAFFDSRIGRKRLVDYSFAKSLDTEFENVQKNNEMFQTENQEENAQNIAKDEAYKNDKELAMLDIEEFKLKYDEMISRIPINEQHKVEMINKLLNQSEIRDLKYINLENMVALDKDGNIVEAYRTTLDPTEVAVGEVSTIENDKVSNVEKNDNTVPTLNEQPSEQEMNNEIAKEEIVPAEDNTKDEDFKKMVEDEMKIRKIEGSVDNEYNIIIGYTNNMDKLENDYENKLINDNKYEFYKTLCDEYIKANTLKNKDTLSLTYTNPDSGYVTIFFISFAVIMISILALILINF